MGKIIGVGFKLSEDDAERLKRALEEVGLTQTKFFRACVDKFLSGDQEEFLHALGFEKKFFWSKP